MTDKKTEALKLALGYMDGTLATDHLTGYERKRYVMEAIREALAEQPANQVDDINVVDIPAQQCQHQRKNISSKRQTVYQCEHCGIYTFDPPAPETLRLVAELLEALENLVMVSQHLGACQGTVEYARKVIAKATGELK